MSRVYKVRVKGDGTTELHMDCPRCGGKKLGVNTTSRLFHCWNCSYGGRLSGDVEFDVHTPKNYVAPVAMERMSDLPTYARKAVRDRGFDPLYLERDYRVQWDGERMAWPAGEGSWSRRAVEPWEFHKTLTAGPKGILGEHRITVGSTVVITEGDYKAAAIPRPWVGVGLCGVWLTARQKDLLLRNSPSRAIIMLDSGKEPEARRLRAVLGTTSATVVELSDYPPGTGPDDIPRKELYRLLRTS